MPYIHPDDKRIKEFVKAVVPDGSSLKAAADSLLAWFDDNVEYSRLTAPFYPLQRSDLDVITMLSGTCGDYSNLLVSVLLCLGFEAGYAYVHRDCFGDEQDHICAAAREGGEWILIDAALPYRQWYGFDCPHRDRELLSPEEFEERMRKEEAYWTDLANRYGEPHLAGLFYAPWLHERIVRRTADAIDSIFYLADVDKQMNTALFAYYLRYTKKGGSIPIVGRFSNGGRSYRFSCREPKTLWDDEQWGEEYTGENIPAAFQTEELDAFMRYTAADLPVINGVLEQKDG